MKMRLNKSACAGHALCNGIDGDLFPLDDSGYSLVEEHELAPAEVDVARRAAQSCPEAALLLEDGA
jgi:ferredoxin